MDCFVASLLAMTGLRQDSTRKCADATSRENSPAISTSSAQTPNIAAYPASGRWNEPISTVIAAPSGEAALRAATASLTRNSRIAAAPPTPVP